MPDVVPTRDPDERQQQIISELSPHEAELDWSTLTEPDEMAPVLDCLGRATAKVRCVSDTDSEQTLVDFQTEEAIVEAVGADVEGFVGEMVEFGLAYGEVTRTDHRLFVDAFRDDRVPGIQATTTSCS